MTDTEFQSCRRSVEFHATREHHKKWRHGIKRDDLVQEGYVALLGSAARYKDTGVASLASYADRGIRGAMSRFAQKERVKGVVGFGYQTGKPLLFVPLYIEGADGEPVELPELPPWRGPRPDAVAETSQVSQIVREAVQELPDREREVMTLFLHELDQPTIARRLGLSQPGVSHILRRAAERLRERLSQIGY